MTTAALWAFLPLSAFAQNLRLASPRLQVPGSPALPQSLRAAEWIDTRMRPLDEAPSASAGSPALEVLRAAVAEPASDAPPGSCFDGLGPQAPSPEERSIVGQYIGGHHLSMNSYRRLTPEEWRESEFAEDFSRQKLAEEHELLETALSKLPAVRMTTYRGTFLPDKVLAQLEAGGLFSDEAPFSTSARGDLFFLPFNVYRQPGHTRVYFVVHGRSGRDVSMFAPANLSVSEKEVLFRGKTALPIESIKEKTASLPGREGRYVEITLVERENGAAP